MFKNMKIAINDQQPLDEVVMELKRLGCWFNMDDGNNKQAKWILVMGDRYDIYNNDRCVDGDWCKLTTLSELRSMNIETLKEME